MSVIAYYTRLPAASLDLCRSNSAWRDALFDCSIPDTETIDIDEAWDGLVWVLSRFPAPAGTAASGAGTVLPQPPAVLLRGEGGASDRRLKTGFGPASVLSPRLVQEMSEWLRTIDPAEMRRHYDPAAMEADEVTPSIWTEEGETAFDDYLLPSFHDVQTFFSQAAAAQQHVIVFYS